MNMDDRSDLDILVVFLLILFVLIGAAGGILYLVNTFRGFYS